MATHCNHLYKRGVFNVLSGNLGLPSQGASGSNSIVTNGGDITIQWNSDGIFMISGGVA
jgi:hypothetical protein